MKVVEGRPIPGRSRPQPSGWRHRLDLRAAVFAPGGGGYTRSESAIKERT